MPASKKIEQIIKNQILNMDTKKMKLMLKQLTQEKKRRKKSVSNKK